MPKSTCIGALGIEYDTASAEADRIEGEQTRLREEANRANDPVVKERLEREANKVADGNRSPKRGGGKGTKGRQRRRRGENKE